MKRRFTVNYIDGHDLRYKSFETCARTESEAIEKLWDSYSELGDFNHQIAGIICKPLSIVDIIRG